MELNEVRKNIDRIDSELLKLLNQRMEFALRTKKMKNDVTDENREKELLEKIKRNSNNLITQTFGEKIFKEIVAESKRLQTENQLLVGFQGEHGAYSEIAVREYNKNAAAIPCKEFTEVFESIKSGALDYGVLPVENSIEGAVGPVNDLLFETDLTIIGEIKVPIHHCLLAPRETDYRDIKTVYSHPQALAQCRGFLSRNKLETRQFYDTAGAALMLSNERPKAAAAIASKLCASMYDLEVLKENIEDHESNTTRFLVLSRERNKEKGDKCSIVFTTKHKAGALFSVLKLFSDGGVNLTRIESRPIRNEAGNVAFMLDFEGSDGDGKIKDVLEKLKEETASFKFLGCYKGAKS